MAFYDQLKLDGDGIKRKQSLKYVRSLLRSISILNSLALNALLSPSITDKFLLDSESFFVCSKCTYHLLSSVMRSMASAGHVHIDKVI